jgi:uncharacterized repeat protein (TIGR02543 family)
VNNEVNEKKNSINKSSILIIGGLLLVIVIGVIVANVILQGSGSGSFFAKLATNGKVKVTYNYNLFDAKNYDTSVVNGYNPTLQTLVFNGNMSDESMTLGKLSNIKLNKGEKYSLYVKCVGGSYTAKKGVEPKISLELQKDDKSYTGRTSGKHYIVSSLPAASNKSFEKTIVITNDNADANGIAFELSIGDEDAINFKNYRLQIFVSKVAFSQKTLNQQYGTMPVPTKAGYEFLGWYDSLSGNNKIIATTKLTKKYNHTLYAHWKAKLESIPTTCREGYNLVEEKCVAQCDVSGCDVCLTPNVCSKCKENYTLSGGKCIQANKCSANCSECDSEGNCKTCAIGYELKDKTCVRTSLSSCNITNCMTCKSGSCTKCNIGYKLENGKCVTATTCNVQNCSLCTALGKCSKCNNGYTLQNDQCVKSSNSGSCSCITGKYSGYCLKYYDTKEECTANCDSACGTRTNKAENKTSYYCKKQVKDATDASCEKALGEGYTGTLPRELKTISCGTYSNCTDACKNEGYTMRSGTCKLSSE